MRPPLPKGADETALPPMGSPEVAMPQPVIARDIVRYVGEIVAMVVADTKDHARDAAEQIEIDYAPLPAVVATSASPQPDAASVWTQFPDNVCFSFKKGDRAAVDAAFAKAHHVTRLELHQYAALGVSLGDVAAISAPTTLPPAATRSMRRPASRTRSNVRWRATCSAFQPTTSA